jgi:UPF0755 protein
MQPWFSAGRHGKTAFYFIVSFSGGIPLLRILSVLLILIVIAGLAAGGLGYWALMQYDAAGPGRAESLFVVEKGSGVSQIGYKLERQGLISDARIFVGGAYYFKKQQALKAGEYSVPKGASMREIMALIESGKSIVYKLTVPEGLTTAMIIDLVKGHEALSGAVTVLPTEGALLPETYVFQRGMQRNELLRLMAQDHNKALDELWETRAADLPVTSKYQAVILASLIEKETGKPDERPRVAGVFVNRLKKGMKLESDPTIIYGITRGYPLGRGIRQSELEAQTPYNTYVVTGLPPTPIANPGRASLAAALNPAPTEDLFFVADGSGGHAFAATLEEHAKNVARWREIEKTKAVGGG